ncbi:dTDP-4-dehydrorhamnose reductase [Rhizobium sp. 2MFCol3.1]|uniref:dTDP-4-dehydrorhamnose reductase n=1 Tax=Rhizobium sp. 2MFCol3.1 TaxID=1246459 RepID=UPI0003611FCA|nr:dTDP-4-dehydrorhamnose reductase [Rhizobium sp. 2MFCol3.1]
MRLLLTGKNGQVGFELQRSLAPLGEVVAVDRGVCDLTNYSQLRAVIRDTRPDVIVNPAAYTAVDKAETEQDLAFAINGMAPGVIGEEAARLGALVVHYSTDYVFDGGGEGFYTEEQQTNPPGIYGRSKLAGEASLRCSGARHLIFRTSWVAGVHGANFTKTMLRLAAESDEINVVADQVGAPTTADLIADATAHAVRAAVRVPQNIPSGVYHLVAGGETNWHAYAVHIIETARLAGKPIRVASDAIRAITSAEYPTPAKRPTNSRLDTSKFRGTFNLSLPQWQAGIDHILQQMI